jgi:hypothetical protein
VHAIIHHHPLLLRACSRHQLHMQLQGAPMGAGSTGCYAE